MNYSTKDHDNSCTTVYTDVLRWFSVRHRGWHLLRLYFWIVVTRMTHGTESRHKEVIASVIRRCVFLNVGKFDELENEIC